MGKSLLFWSQFIPQTWNCVFKNYSPKLFRHDLFAGITVGLVAIPLAMAFAIASGVDPERGIYTAVVAGFLISFLGGSRFQIGGPTGAFVVILYGIIQREGYEGLVLSGLLGGFFLIVAALLRLGSLVKYVPYPLVTGFTAGIALILFSSQVIDFLGLQTGKVPADFLAKWQAIFSSLPTCQPLALSTGLITFLLILIFRRFFPFLPWGICSITLVTAVTSLFKIPVETVASRFGAMSFSWSLPSFDSLPYAKIISLIPDGLAIAFLAGIESLLSAVVADSLAGTRHKSNCELMAQGVANLASACLGGIPATGAIARTATNVKTGAKTPLSGMIHALVLLLSFLFLAPVMSQIPLASLAALLVMVAWSMSEVERFVHLFRAPKADIAILLTAFFLTVFVDLTVAMGAGLLLAMIFFVKKMGDCSRILSHDRNKEEKDSFFQDSHKPTARQEVPPGIEVFDVEGPLFFGAANKLKSLLVNWERPAKVYILRVHQVPLIDATGMEALRELAQECKKERSCLFLSGVRPSLFHSLQKFGLVEALGRDRLFASYEAALSEAKLHLTDSN